MKVLTAHFLVAAEDTSSYPIGGHREIAFAGRSNVGKSSMINALLGRRNLVRISKTPGRTRKLNFFLINNRFVLVDLPGYGFASVSQTEKAKWATMVETYLKVRKELAGVVLIVDSRRLPTESDREMINYLIHYAIPFTVAATKADKLNRSQIVAQKRSMEAILGKDVPVIVFSARSGQGKTELWKEIRDLIDNAECRRDQGALISAKKIPSDRLIANGPEIDSKLLV
jgi:GTP-binding protein